MTPPGPFLPQSERTRLRQPRSTRALFRSPRSVPWIPLRSDFSMRARGGLGSTCGWAPSGPSSSTCCHGCRWGPSPAPCKTSHDACCCRRRASRPAMRSPPSLLGLRVERLSAGGDTVAVNELLRLAPAPAARSRVRPRPHRRPAPGRQPRRSLRSLQGAGRRRPGQPLLAEGAHLLQGVERRSSGRPLRRRSVA